jgi:hypothetical protein
VTIRDFYVSKALGSPIGYRKSSAYSDKTLVWKDEADSGMSIVVLTHHFPTRAQFIEMCNLTALGAGHALPLLVLITYLF